MENTVSRIANVLNKLGFTANEQTPLIFRKVATFHHSDGTTVQVPITADISRTKRGRIVSIYTDLSYNRDISSVYIQHSDTLTATAYLLISRLHLSFFDQEYGESALYLVGEHLY
jgi:hypothetical protein